MTDKPGSHTLYSTRHRPRLLDRRCPRCTRRVRMVKDSERDWIDVHGSPIVLVGDGAETWRKADWGGRCTHCLHELRDLGYQDLPPHYYSDENSGIWAWNREHLDHLCCMFDQRADDDNPYAFFDGYLPGDWLRRRAKTLRVLRRLRDRD